LSKRESVKESEREINKVNSSGLSDPAKWRCLCERTAKLHYHHNCM